MFVDLPSKYRKNFEKYFWTATPSPGLIDESPLNHQFNIWSMYICFRARYIFKQRKLAFQLQRDIATVNWVIWTEMSRGGWWQGLLVKTSSHHFDYCNRYPKRNDRTWTSSADQPQFLGSSYFALISSIPTELLTTRLLFFTCSCHVTVIFKTSNICIAIARGHCYLTPCWRNSLRRIFKISTSDNAVLALRVVHCILITGPRVIPYRELWVLQPCLVSSRKYIKYAL